MCSIKSDILKEMYQILGTYDLLKLKQGALKKLNNVPKSNIILAITKIFRTKTCSELYGLTEEFFLFFKEELKPMLLYLCYKTKKWRNTSKVFYGSRITVITVPDIDTKIIKISITIFITWMTSTIRVTNYLNRWQKAIEKIQHAFMMNAMKILWMEWVYLGIIEADTSDKYIDSNCEIEKKL